MDKLHNNPHYENGLFWGRQMAKQIDRTTYRTLENAIEAKRQLVVDLKENLGWDENSKDIAENLGIIKALEEALAPENKFVPTKGNIQEIAEDINRVLSEEQIESILENFDDFVAQNPGIPWKGIVKGMISIL